MECLGLPFGIFDLNPLHFCVAYPRNRQLSLRVLETIRNTNHRNSIEGFAIDVPPPEELGCLFWCESWAVWSLRSHNVTMRR